MARLALLAPLFVLAACGLEKSGTRPDQPDTGIVDSGTPDVVSDAPPDAPGCDPKSCKANEYCKAGACTLLASCSEIRQVDPTANTARYSIRTSSMAPGTSIVVFCEMSTAGGGWTLVAATDASGTAPFGWGSPRNDPAVLNDVYVLDLAKGFKFTKAMISVRGAGLSLASPTITFDLPPLGPLGGSTTSTTNLKVVTPLSPCTTNDVPQTLAVLGNTSLTSSFYFSKSNTITDVGILPTGFLSSEIVGGCTTDHLLGGKQVLLFGHE